MLQPILVDSSDFTEIRENECIYVDKTAYFHKLITRRDARRFFPVAASKIRQVADDQYIEGHLRRKA